MKTLITILLVSTALNLSAQEFVYSGVAKVIDTDGHNYTIVFKNAKHFIIKKQAKCNDLKVNKNYYFLLKPKTFKGSKITAQTIFCYEDNTQNFKERARLIDSIKQPIVNY